MERRFSRQLEDKKKKAKDRLLYAGLISLFVHGAAPVAMESDKIMDRVRIELRTDDVAVLVKDINAQLEQGQGIEDMDGFLLQSEYLEQGFSQEELELATRELNRIITQAQELKDQGKSKQEIADYLLSEQGEYNKHQNSLIELLIKSKASPEEIDSEDTGLERDYRSGDCQARWKLLTAAWSEIFPEDTEQIKTQVFNGADNDGDGRPDNPGHVRVAITLDDGQELVVEGRNSFIEPSSELSLDTSEMLATGYLAQHGLYEHGQGNMQGVSTKKLHDSLFTFPSSPVTYSAWENPDDQPSPFYSNPDRNEYVVEYIPTNTLTLDNIKEKKLYHGDVAKFTDIDTEVLKALVNNDSMDPDTRQAIIYRFNSLPGFESVNSLRSEEVANLLVQIDSLNNVSLTEVGSESILKIITDKAFYLRFGYEISPSEAIIINQGNSYHVNLSGPQNPQAIKELDKKDLSLLGVISDSVYSVPSQEWPEFTEEMAQAFLDKPREHVSIRGYKIDSSVIDILVQADIKSLSIYEYYASDNTVIEKLHQGKFNHLTINAPIDDFQASLFVNSAIPSFRFQEITRGGYDLLVEAGKKVEVKKITEEKESGWGEQNDQKYFTGIEEYLSKGQGYVLSISSDQNSPNMPNLVSSGQQEIENTIKNFPIYLVNISDVTLTPERMRTILQDPKTDTLTLIKTKVKKEAWKEIAQSNIVVLVLENVYNIDYSQLAKSNIEKLHLHHCGITFEAAKKLIGSQIKEVHININSPEAGGLKEILEAEGIKVVM